MTTADPAPAAGPLDGLRHAIGFLTRIPVPFRAGEAPRLDLAVPWFPLVGALAGTIAAAVLAAAAQLPGAGASGVAAALGLAAGIVATGGLHEDGLADSADGLGVHGDRERRLAVLRDSRLGTFGALALIVWALVSWSALRALSTEDAVRALVAAGAASRWAVLAHVRSGRPARPDGAIHALRIGPVGAVVATAVALAACLPLLGPVAGLVALAVAGALGGLLAAGAGRAFGGLTGDTCGAVAALAQATTLVVALAFAA